MLEVHIAQALQSLDETLSELSSLGEVDAEQLLTDWRTRMAVERALQILVEVVIDVCQRLISVQGQTPANTSITAIERCIQLGALSDDPIYRQMVRFRNFIVHRYERVDSHILADMVNQRLIDFEQFRDEILRYVKTH
ncbi:MAG: DUF86 domain-containing protein [Anaerolineae bacterium]|nr:DUF86 domain-containing protein [Anaerolineae bacterium]